ncbi:MAG TPA: glutamine synthetase family protein [Burkholderiales bacterium]|jgi:glutamine synthetase|nr:glutamine synthetase family protein [Burkholderiales bacterium]
MNLPKGLKAVRFSFADQHGVLRGKTLSASAAEAAMERGVTVTSTLLLKDTSHKTVFPAFTPGGGVGMPEMQGAADILMIPDPSTFRTLPWAPDTGWFLCDLKFPDGRAVPFSTRDVLRRATEKLASGGYEFVAGLEVEFHVFRIRDPRLQPADAGQPGNPPDVELLTTGYQLLTEQKYDQLDGVVQLLRDGLSALELPFRSFEIEFGPSQLELTLAPRSGIAAADAMILLRSAVKQIARRHGYHATFMCRPKLPNVMSSGWHLHQSLSRNGLNAFVSEKEDLSEVGKQYLAGLLAHARAACAFATPTINGYKRYRPYSLAPDRVIWGKENRGAMLRVVGAPRDPDTRIENRIGEPAANPYLYFASQIYCGLDGIERRLPLPRSADTPYEAKADMLPRTLDEALQHLRADKVLRHGFGAGFIDYYCRVKEAEIARFNLEVSDWEHREYFDLF